MQRDTSRLRESRFDLLIVGGGVYGAALAFEGAARGARVALIEQGDFAAGASSNSLKILHGGFRYLQQANLARMRSSIRARRGWCVLAPELVRPLACAIASHGVATRSYAAMGLALAVNDLVSADRNAGVVPEKRIPRGRMLGRREFGTIAAPALGEVHTAGCRWWDVLALDSEALVMGLLADAATSGAVVSNYTPATSLLMNGSRVDGVVASDLESGSSFEIHATRTVLATGCSESGLAANLPADGNGTTARPSCWALNLVLNRKWHSESALALSEPEGDRQLFFVPWRDRTMVGTHYVPRRANQDEAQVRRSAAMELVGLAAAAAPGLGIAERDIALIHWGSLPLAEEWRPGAAPRLSASPSLVDYGHRGGLAGLWSLTGVKFTTALEVARWALPQILQGLVMRSMGPGARRFGMLAPLAGAGSPQQAQAAGERAAREWLARHLEDAVFRRTGLGSAGYPGRQVLDACARGMATVLGWDEGRIGIEIDKTMALYRERHFWKGQE